MRSSRALTVTTLAGTASVALALVLTGCVPTPTTKPSASASGHAGASHSASAEPSSSPSPSVTPSAAPTPVTLSCDQVMSAQSLYDFNPNFGRKAPYTPKPGSAAARALKDKGVACEWINQSSNDPIDVSIAHYDPATIAALQKSTAGTGGGWGADASGFSVAGGVGSATAFVGDYWIVAASPTFAAAVDADAFMNSAVAAVK